METVKAKGAAQHHCIAVAQTPCGGGKVSSEVVYTPRIVLLGRCGEGHLW